ncbi:copper homeostasis protein CutC [Pontibacter sp. 172403-2]|uniref:copper homeostasis protein CutC n=1 Tax=Pontibacter rufus TaxID=2791028 RepID=UPI0018B007F9|nr:copper homeostasis protein CutC [Pontibacter sp. 172403-2]MBF9255133.1 copper homeostasis protein CutC [Pontibacter sp. 172403-2]
MAGQKLVAEICVDSAHAAIAAEQGGAQRVELCDSLIEGGTTPSAGMIALTRAHISIGLHVLIRPRRGDFLYSDLEFDIMKHDIEVAKKLGADGVVLGILKADGNIDTARTGELMTLAYPLSITFHRAFDLTPDPFRALDDLLQLKADRLLTSGQQPTALAGAQLISELVKKANDRIIIMPGAGINEQNVQQLITQTGAGEYHTSARSRTDGDMLFRRNDLFMASATPLSEYEHFAADAAKVSAIRAAAEAALQP